MTVPMRSLVIANKGENEAITKLFEHGFASITRTSTKEALSVIRHNRVTAIVIDLTFQRLDLLEFVLNVRDFDTSIPLLLFGNLPDTEASRIILRQSQVYYFEKITDSAIRKLKEVQFKHPDPADDELTPDQMCCS